MSGAIDYYNRALEIDIKINGHDQPAVAASCQNIAVVYLRQGKQAQAIEMATKAYDINLKVRGPDHPSTKKLKSFLGK